MTTYNPIDSASNANNPQPTRPSISSQSFLYPHHSPEIATQLISTANSLVHPRGRGIYATDETPEAIETRLVAAANGGDDGKDVKTFSEEEKRERRKRWRECLYESLTPEHISGVIIFSETLHEFNLAPTLQARGIIPGIRADTDSQPLPCSPLEPATQGLDDLLPRLRHAYAAGARFAKWHAPILCTSTSTNSNNTTGPLPTQSALETQSESLAHFASIAQQAGLVPIVEPDVDFSGDADLARSVEVHVRVISMIYARCAAYGVLIEGTLIKPSFPQPGLKHPSRSTTSADDIVSATLAVLARSVPVGVAGVVFLSGGLPDSTALDYLFLINSRVSSLAAEGSASTALSSSPYTRLPPLSFSFGRGLQGDATKRWVEGDEEGAKRAFAERARACWAAVCGK
ncbi:aldolase [Rickenella mellea]|uniref:fructose-bisphosphate aldolase n=1 Tax=Rickenella mellea TaxID=50990 RepID=A0A4Y7PRV1_9AGAM|nr:aldolase [Rickenella mellea]